MIRAALLPALVVLLAYASPVAAEAPTHAVPVVRPVQLDGRVLTAEWADALALPLAPGTTLRLQQFRGTVMLGFESDRIWSEGSILTLFLCPDGADAGGRGPGCVRLDYEPFRHDREHVILYRYGAAGAAERLHGRSVVRSQLGPEGTQLEIAFAAELLGLTAELTGPIRLCAQWARRGAPALYYPNDVDFRAGGAEAPPDFVSAARWARLEGLAAPNGPGAFPDEEWQAWVDHDAEIARRGRTAHMRMQLLSEEWLKEDKADKILGPEVLDEFAWIAQHEPLAPEDVLVKTTLLRFLNRHAEADAVLTTLIDVVRRPDITLQALHQRALVRRAAERYDDEAADWRQLAERAGAIGGRYADEAKRAEAAREGWAREQEARKAAEADPTNPRVRLETPHGEIELVLYADKTPASVAHFLALVESQFYDGTLFHRVKGNFMAQGGDPKSRELGCEFAGAGSSGAEVEVESNSAHDFYRGALCFARAEHRETNGSQFFLVTAPKPRLGSYTIFGHVVRGQAAADRLELCDPLLRAQVLTR
ncbi:MAG: peptidylprolyl isomerase [Planctomycetota bacterium]|nr:peptidylprolyl isomerase [Planctomycetota bacterium]